MTNPPTLLGWRRIDPESLVYFVSRPLLSSLPRSFNTSMEVYLRVWGEDLSAQYKYLSNEAYLTFVALDPNGRPRKVPELVPETEDEKRFYDGALRRRQLRLVLGGKMKTEDAGELRALFVKE